MKLLLLAEIRSTHTVKWANYLSDRGIDIAIFSLFANEEWVTSYRKNIKFYSANLPDFIYHRKDGSLLKITYAYAILKLRKVIKEIRPDLLHAHYVSSYGILGALSGFKPFIISVWGSDIYEFPLVSIFHRKIMESSLNRASAILSTSHVMAKEIQKYTPRQIMITPFGIDLSVFYPQNVSSDHSFITIGTVKSLETKYGMEYLLEAFKIVNISHPHVKLRLLIVGGGSLKKMLMQKAEHLQINHVTEFTGYINYNEIALYHNKIDVSVFPSIHDSESFGVSVLEASACGKPVVVSNIGGLKEVVVENETGLYATPKDPVSLAKAISKLIDDPALRIRMGENGRNHVKKYYNIEENVNQMVEIYRSVMASDI